MQWEYTFVEYGMYGGVAESTQKAFAELGEDGWELTNTVWTEGQGALSIFTNWP